MRLFLAGLLLAGSTIWAAELATQVSQVLESSAAAQAAFWGVQVVDLSSGKILVSQNANRLFVPASNTKLFTTALALIRLGPDHRFLTTVLAPQAPDSAGIVTSLRLVGGGDPNLSARVIPYHPDPNIPAIPAGNPLEAIEDLAGQIFQHGVRRVDGDVIGDDTAYIWEPYPEGWAVDDGIWDYGAPVSALSINDNTVALRLLPGERVGDLARLKVIPALEFYAIDNRVHTIAGKERKILVDRVPAEPQVRLWGQIPLKDAGEVQFLGIAEPAVYAARALADALARRGVAVTGRAVACHLYPNQVADLKVGPAPQPTPGVELARRVSAPLFEDLRITDKISQNLHAEMALRAVGRVTRHIGSREAGLEEMKAFLAGLGVEETGYVMHDGSGLTRLNLVSPAAVVGLLRYMYASPRRDYWVSFLPVGGVDGTLHTRFGEIGATRGRILAKTGSLSHVSALSGYAERKDGKILAFSILVNNYQAPTSEVRALIDKICMLMLD